MMDIGSISTLGSFSEGGFITGLRAVRNRSSWESWLTASGAGTARYIQKRRSLPFSARRRKPTKNSIALTQASEGFYPGCISTPPSPTLLQISPPEFLPWTMARCSGRVWQFGMLGRQTTPQCSPSFAIDFQKSPGRLW